MTGNPIVTKELVTALRSRAAFAVALLAVGALSLLALAAWPRAGVNPLGWLHSRLFMTAILSGLLALLVLITPPFSATSITHERESNTWEMLYYSLLRPDQILTGKLVGAVAFILMLVGLSLPVTASGFILGGISGRELLASYLVLATAGVTFGLVGLACSAWAPSSRSALIATYVALLVLCGGVHVPITVVPEWREGQPVLHAIRCLSPFSALLAITRDAFRSMGSQASAQAVRRYFGYSGLLCGAMVASLLVRIGMRPRPRIAKRKGVVDEAPLGIRILRRVLFVLDPRRRRRSIGLWVNPVFVLDLRTRVAGLSNILRAGFLCLILAIGLVILVAGTYGATRPDVIRLIALSFQMGLIVLVGPSLTVGAVAGEVEEKTFDALRMTPLRAWTIFFGKFAAAGLLSLLLVVSSVPIFFAVLYIQEAVEWRLLTAMAAVTVVTLLFVLSAGLFFSCMCRTTARAGAWAYGLTGLVTVGTLSALLLQGRLSDAAAKAILAFNPVVTAVGAVSARLFAEFGYWPNTLLALGSVSAMLIAATVWRLHRLVGPLP